MLARDEIQKEYKKGCGNIYFTNSEGYWSNLNNDENKRLLVSLQKMNTRDAIKRYHPELFEVIFSPKRSAGLELLDMYGSELCIDYGCMWGALTVALAKRCKYVLGIDQTLDSLEFLNARIKEDKLENVDLLCADLQKIKILKNKFDIAIVNGVLEWIPEEGPVELKKFYGKRCSRKYSCGPRQQQLAFLKKVYENLNNNGKLYLAIENRFDFKMFLGAKDPHANLQFVSFLPRKIADIISIACFNRKYVNWLYSFDGIRSLLKEAHFSKVDLYMCFPDYRFPERIIPYNGEFRNFVPSIFSNNSKGTKTVKRYLAKIIEVVLFKILKAKYLSPSIIAVGYK